MFAKVACFLLVYCFTSNLPMLCIHNTSFGAHFVFSALSSIKAQEKTRSDEFSGSREVTAVYLSIEVFLREKPSPVAIHPVSMKLEAHLPWSFMTFTSGKSRPCHIYFPLSPGLYFPSCCQSHGGRLRKYILRPFCLKP